MTSKLGTLSLCALIWLTYSCGPVPPPRTPVAQAKWVPLTDRATSGTSELTKVSLPPVSRARKLTKDEAIKIVQTTAKAGDAEDDAVKALAIAGFACRPLSDQEFGRLGPEHLKELSCWAATDLTEAGYMLAYGNLAVNHQGKLIRVATGSYPVIYRNLRVDVEGRTIVVQDPTQRKRP